MADRWWLRGASVWDAATRAPRPAALEVVGDRVGELRPGGEPPEGARSIDGSGLVVLPGLTDLHVHLRDPGLTWKEDIASGTQAAVAGGVTSVVALANTQPVNDHPEVTRYILDRTRREGWCRVLPVSAATMGLAGEQLAPYHQMIEAGCVAVSDDGQTVPTAGVMRRVLEYADSFGLIVLPHCEDRSIRAGGVMNAGPVAAGLGLPGNPREAEEVALARDLLLAKLTGAHLHVQHLTTAAGVEMVRRAKEAGLRVTAEACPHHLFLTDEAVEALGTHAKMAPPLRTASDVEAVRQGLRDGIIDILATDHAPHAPHEKDQPFEMAPDGIIGLETLLPLGLRLVSEGVLDLATFVDRAVMAPRRVLGLAPTSPAAGEPADFAVVDAGRAWTYRADEGCSRSRNTPFDGWSFAGRAVLTVVAGVVRWDLDGRAAAAGVPVRQGVA
jgi:dihydroorotase